MKKTATLFLIVCVAQSYAQHISKEMLKPLEQLVGSWNVEANMRLSKTGPWEKSNATSIFRKSVGESIFEEEYTGTKEGRVFTFQTWIANDNRTKLYQKVSVDSDHGVLVLYEGTLQKDTLSLQTQLQLTDYLLILRVQYIFISNDSFTVENARSVDGGKSWDMTSQFTYTRTK